MVARRARRFTQRIMGKRLQFCPPAFHIGQPSNVDLRAPDVLLNVKL